MEQQSRYIAELRNEIYNLKNETRAEAMVASTNTCKIDENCKKTIEENFARHENILNIRHKQHRELLETITRNQMITIESALKENLLKICTHKAFVESISNSILFGIQYSLETSFKKSLEETMIPSYQKITHEMFQEVAKTFSAGIKEYTRAFDTYMKQYGAVQFQMTEFSGVIHQIPTQVRQTALDAVVPHMNSGFHDIRQRLEKFQSKIIGDVLQQVKNEIQNGFEKQTLSLEDSVLSVVQRSHAETPAPTVYDHQEAIKQLLANGEVNKAFHQALILSDLPLLEFTIEKADYNSVFTGESPCELEQSVLLSLIQQLTADMTKYNELKNR
jgi:enhancer of mRNA-decapping protein 4